MALIMSEVKFASPVPEPEAIARQASAICGLAIRYQSDEHVLTDVYPFSGSFHFEVAPDRKVEAHGYHAAASKPESKYPREPSVDLRTGMGSELTLFHTLELALVKLGGVLSRERDLSEHDKVLTIDELQGRFRKNRNFHLKSTPLYVLVGLTTIVVIPFQLLWTIVRMPFQLFRLRRERPELFKKPPT